MRSIFLVIITALVLTLGGFVYFMMQGRNIRPASLRHQTASTRPAIHRPDSTLGVSDGDHVFVKKYDPRTGELASEFVAEEYTPRRGGLVDVKNAIARFYLDKGQIIELHGATGSFRTDTPQEGRRKGFTEARAGAPDRGQLKDVTVTMLETLNPNTPRQTTRPTMVIAMDNAAFDSGNATIVTEAYTDPVTHKLVPADQVPVTVRSPDTNPNGYDFDGRGLKMLWNERDHRLTSLDVIHGERLVIKNPKSVTQPKAQPAAPHSNVTLLPMLRPLANSAVASLDSYAGLLAAAAAADPAPAAESARAARRRRARREGAATEPTAPAPAASKGTEPATPASATTQPARTRGTRRHGYEPPPPSMPKITANTEPPIYRAEFHDNVRIVQNGQPLANADLMLVDFWMKSGGDDSSTAPTQPGGRHRGTTRPATTTASAAATEPATHPAVAAATTTTAPSTTAPAAGARAVAKKATSRPGEDAPIYIYWTGPLHVAPHSGLALGEHDSVVTLEGAPVVAQQDASSQIRASRLVYRTEDGSVHAAAMPNTDVTLTSADQHGKSIIHTTGLEYYANAQPPTAILTGHSTAALPAQTGGGMLNAIWNDRCTLRFERTSDGGSAIKEADLTGNVHVDHPQLKLDSNRLELAFAHPTTRPAPAVAVAAATTGPTSKASGLSSAALKQLVASDNVHCVMTDNQGKVQTIDGDRLTLITEQGADGKLIPRTVNADGKVHAVDEERDLHADHLAVTLAPTTRPATTAPAKPRAAVAAASQPTTRPAGDDSLAGNVDLESLIAQGAVHVVGKKDNTQAFADTMLIDKKFGKTNVKLVGAQPGAKIIEKTNTVIGPIIDISNDDQTLAVDGAGEMIGTQQDHPGEPGKPMHVYWTRNMRINGKANVVNAFGNVQAKTTEADGTVRTVSGERARLLLIDAPTTQPSTKPAKPTTQVAATTKPATGDVAEPMARKQIRQAIFEEDARVKSELNDAEGLPIQRMNLWASMLQYDLIPVPAAPGQPPQEPNKRITVPVPGKMIVEDYRPASTQPAAAAAESSPTGGMGARGATAFQWVKSLIYDDASHRATMDGSIVIDHRDDIEKDDSMHITGDTVIADIEPAQPQPKTPATGPAMAATTKPASTQPRVRNVVVRDHVHVTMKGGELVASWIEYNPITRVLIAHGTPDADAVFTRALDAAAATQPGKAGRSVLGGTQPIRAQELQWDAGADLPKITKGNATFRR